MGQFDVHRSADGLLLVDIQADMLADLTTRIVVPLIPVDLAPKPMRGLNPACALEGQSYVLVTQFMSAMRRSELGDTIGSLKQVDQDISRALDLALHGI